MRKYLVIFIYQPRIVSSTGRLLAKGLRTPIQP